MAKSKKNKSVQTRKKREQIFKQFEERAKENSIKWNYERAKKIHEISQKKDWTLEYTFRRELVKSRKQKAYYVSKKYGLSKDDSYEVVKKSIEKKTSYSLQVEDIKEKGLAFPVIEQNYLQFIEFMENAEKQKLFTENAEIVIEVASIYYKGGVSQFNKVDRLTVRKDLENELEDNVFEGKKYVVVQGVLNVKTTRDFLGKIKKVHVTLSRISEEVLS